MSAGLDLKELERKAFRSTFQDGLWDLYVAALLLINAVFLSLPDTDETWLRMLAITISLGGAGLALWAGKKFLITPRLGHVKFGPQRRRKGRQLAWILAAFVLLHTALFLFQLAAWNNPDLAAGLRAWLPDQGGGRLLLGGLVGIWLAMVMSVIAFYNDLPRGYYFAAVIGLGFFFALWLDQPLYLVIAALLVGLPGLVLFVRFLRDHPLPAGEQRHVRS